MTVDLTLRAGDIIQLFGFLIVAIGLYFGVKSDLARLHDKHEVLNDDVEEIKGSVNLVNDKIYRHVTNTQIHYSRTQQ